jgi:hypothetical protein
MSYGPANSGTESREIVLQARVDSGSENAYEPRLCGRGEDVFDAMQAQGYRETGSGCISYVVPCGVIRRSRI